MIFVVAHDAISTATANVCFTYVCRCFLSSARLQVLLAACLLDLCVAKEKKKIELLSARRRSGKSGNGAAAAAATAARQVFYTFKRQQRRRIFLWLLFSFKIDREAPTGGSARSDPCEFRSLPRKLRKLCLQ